MIRTYTALNGQSIYDVCLMTYGTLDRLFKLIGDNNFGSVNNYPFVGQSFTWDDTLIFNDQVSQTNKLANINYATASSNVGNIIYNIQENGLPVNGQQIVSPPAPNLPGSNKYDYYLVFNTDIRWSNGRLTFTDPYLKGRSGYAVYAQQLSQFFSVTQDADLHYDSIAGTFTILTPSWQLLDTYYLVIYPNKYDTQIP